MSVWTILSGVCLGGALWAIFRFREHGATSYGPTGVWFGIFLAGLSTWAGVLPIVAVVEVFCLLALLPIVTRNGALPQHMFAYFAASIQDDETKRQVIARGRLWSWRELLTLGLWEDEDECY